VKLVTLPTPIPELQHAPLPLLVLRAGACPEFLTIPLFKKVRPIWRLTRDLGVRQSDMSNRDQQVAEELCLMWNMKTLGAPFVNEFCVSTLQLVKPHMCFNKVHLHMGERQV